MVKRDGQTRLAIKRHRVEPNLRVADRVRAGADAGFGVGCPGVTVEPRGDVGPVDLDIRTQRHMQDPSIRVEPEEHMTGSPVDRHGHRNCRSEHAFQPTGIGRAHVHLLASLKSIGQPGTVANPVVVHASTSPGPTRLTARCQPDLSGPEPLQSPDGKTHGLFL